MEKVFDRLFVEFLIPAFLMLACGLLFLQLLSGGNFDLGRADSRNVFFGNNAFVFGGIVFAYVVNTSLSALLNLISRILLWGKTREYLIVSEALMFSNCPPCNPGCNCASGHASGLGVTTVPDTTSTGLCAYPSCSLGYERKMAAR